MIRIVNNGLQIPKIETKEDARKLFFGRNSEYYLRYYREYKNTKKKTSWNWCACLFSPMWFFARKMYIIGTMFAVMSTLFSLGMGLFYKYSANDRLMSFVIPWIALYVAMSITIGVFGNYLYITHMESKILYPGDKSANGELLSNEQIAKLDFFRGGLTFNGILNGYMVIMLISMIMESIFF